MQKTHWALANILRRIREPGIENGQIRGFIRGQLFGLWQASVIDEAEWLNANNILSARYVGVSA